MPTAVSTARHCLAGDAATALDAAVYAARRRGHNQTTSLHVVFALLSSSSSTSATPPLLRDAVSRARSSRLQSKALELCFGVALDRLPSSRPPPPQSSDDDPPISNSLMAAIKRSQAHQRRNPDTFYLYHQSSSASASSFAGVKVELQQLVLAILDDPVVSRVFGESGFRSCDIKLAVLRPLPPALLRFPRAAPLFLCNFGDDVPPASFQFPFRSSDGDDENCRRIGEILLARRAGRNPVLVGVGAADAARDFTRVVKQRNWSVLPPELRGLKFYSIEREVSDLSGGIGDRSSIRDRLEELGQQAEEEPGLVVSIGDLKGLVEGEGRCEFSASCLVSELSRALEVHRGRLWVMGWSATYEAYMKFLSRYPLLDKDWDLQLLPVTYLRPTMAGLLPRTQSLLESLIPFGGFLPAAYEPKVRLSKSYQSVVRCQHCNDDYEQEVAATLKRCSRSLEDQHQMNMPAWLRKTDMISKNDRLDPTKTKDDSSILSVEVMDLQKKWNDNCQRLHRGCQVLETDNFQRLSHVVDPSYVSDKERASNQNSKNADVSQNQNGCGDPLPMRTGTQVTKASQGITLLPASEPKDKDLISILQVRLSRSEVLKTEGFLSQQGALSELDIQGDSASPSSVTSVTTDLILGTLHETPCKEEQTSFITRMERVEDFSECLPSKINEFSTSVPDTILHSYPCPTYPDTLLKNKYLPTQTLLHSRATSGRMSAYDRRWLSSSNMCEQFDPSNFKTFYTSLVEKVGRQEEALRAISEAIVHCRTGRERRHGASLKGDVWLSFLGHDKVGKKRAAMALAELIFGSRENFICINLGCQGGLLRNNIFDQQDINEYDVRFRGKTIVDRIAEELSKNPWSVVFLENINQADLLVQNSLSQAIHTGKFSNSHGREFSINSAIFVTTIETCRGKSKTVPPEKGSIYFSEERILGAQGCQMKILLAEDSRIADLLVTSRQEPWHRHLPTCSVSVSKHKLDVSDHPQRQDKSPRKRLRTFLDLNLPVEETGASDIDCGNADESNSISDNSEAWVEEFFNLMDENINFRPFDFDALADHVLEEINQSLNNTIGHECTLELDAEVMEQILAATWVLENKGEFNNWLEKVLARSVMELRQRYNPSTRTLLRLVACDGDHMDCAPGILLPSRILVE